jgi:lactoylglutathione lyase
MRLNYAIVTVSDMQRSVSFYRDVLGLPLRFESPSWTEFATEGATLVLHAAPAPAPKAGAADAHAEPAGPCRPGLGVPSVADFHKAMIKRKVRCLQEPTQVFGAWVAQYVDPDGLPISVGEACKR